jgi:hypothetical protein
VAFKLMLSSIRARLLRDMWQSLMSVSAQYDIPERAVA